MKNKPVLVGVCSKCNGYVINLNPSGVYVKTPILFCTGCGADTHDIQLKKE